MDEVAFGRYRLLSLIGEGGMGQVYKAHDTVIDRDVAIKVLSSELGAEPGYRERFRREAHTAARLAEPHIIPIYDTGEIDGRLFLVMPVVEGVDVHGLLQRDGPMSPPRAVHVVEQLAAALDAAHVVGLVHRDVKPSNALVTGRDFVYLIDFGIAHDSAATKLTRTGTIVGSWAYMAPERFTSGTADARADVYALACVLFECLTGVQPYPGDSLEQQFAGHYSTDPPQPTVINRAVPAGFDEVVAHGMAKDPDQRYQSAAELAAAAQQALSTASRGLPRPAPPAAATVARDVDPRLAAPRQRPADRSSARVKWALIAAVVAVLAVSGLAGYLMWPQPSQPLPQSAAPPSDSTTGSSGSHQAGVYIFNISSKELVAGRIAEQLKAAGFNVVEVGNLEVPSVSATTVYYSDSDDERPTANAVGQTLGAPVQPRIDALKSLPAGVIVLATG